MNPFKKKTDVESRVASSSEQALCSVCRHAIPESRRELGLCLDCSTKKDRNKAVLAVGLAGGALAVAKKYGPKVVSKVGPLVVNAVKKIFCHQMNCRFSVCRYLPHIRHAENCGEGHQDV